jgi:diaminohydroxyphosphoribosylaminopyrimidine deaminase/5-amino-6-(5-phosphoribosylamino)uracil reductase
VVLEGGAETLRKFIVSGLWDEARVLTSKSLEFKKGLKSPLLEAEPDDIHEYPEDVLNIYRH